MTRTIDDFIEKYAGQEIDDDGAYGAQCVDGFRVYCRYLGIDPYPTGTGWASGYWETRYDTPQSYKNFDFIAAADQLQKGDVCFWARGSSCPDSHVAIFTEYTGDGRGRFFGENQGAFRGFTFADIPLDIMGAFRWKGWNNEMQVFANAEVLVNNLNIRPEPALTGAPIGQAHTGDRYDVYGFVQNDGYMWLQISPGWIAAREEWVKLSDSTEDNEKIADLERRIDWYLYVIGRASDLITQANAILRGEKDVK